MSPPGANWLAEIAKRQQAPVHFLRIDGHSKDYSTHSVQNAGTPKTVLMEPPTGGGASLDLLTAAHTIQEVEVELLDVADEITDLVATEASGAPLSTLINRKATVYSGFRPLDEADYEPRFTGRIRGVRGNGKGTGYVFTLADAKYLLDGQIMTAATEAKPATIRGNIVNLYASILRGIFSVSDPDFPLESVSTDSGSSSAPTGLGIADSLLNIAQMKTQRDTWHANDKGHVVFLEPEDAREHLTAELFRACQSWAAVDGAGLLGLQFHVPAFALSGTVALDSTNIVSIDSWRQLYSDHLNRFVVKGDYSIFSREYERTLYELDDTTDQTATGETVEYRVESRWLRTEYDGAEIAWELANRMKVRFLKTPALIELTVNAHRLDLQQGDIAAVTHDWLPDLFTGTRGLDQRIMTVLAVAPDWKSGLVKVTLLDTGAKRYGLIAPESKTGDYSTASTADRETYFFICDESGQMSDATAGYRFI